MSVAKVGAIFLVLLILAVQPCWSQCEPVESANLCTKWSNLLKNALLDTDLRPLRDAFFPPSGHPPVLVQVKYILVINQIEVEEYKVGWSSSGLFAAVDPAFAFFFQSMMLNLILYEEGLILKDPVDVVLHVNTILPRNSKEFNYSLDKLTSDLKGYASSQGTLDEATRGYTWNIEHLSIAMDYVVLIAVFFTGLLAQLILLYLAVYYINDLSKREGPIKVLMWSVGDAMSLFNVVLLILELIFLYAVFSVDICILKVILFVFVVVSPISYALLSLCCSRHLPPAPKYAVSCCSFWNCCMTLSCCLPLWIPLCSSRAKQRIAYCGLFINYSLFVSLIATTTVPTILFLGSFPLETISALSLLSFVLVTCIALITTTRLRSLFTDETGKTVDEQKFKKYCKLIYVLSSFTVLSVIIICVLILYIRIIAAGVGTNNFFQFLISIFPAVTAAVIAVWVKKKFFKKLEETTTAAAGAGGGGGVEITGDAVTQTEDKEPLAGNNDHTTIDIELEPLKDQ